MTVHHQPSTVVCKWIEKLAKKLGTTMKYMHQLHTLLVCRANHLREKVRGFSGSAPKQRFLQQYWTLTLQEDEIAMSEMRKKTKDRYNVSHNAYYELAKICKQMPRQYRIGDCIKEPNKLAGHSCNSKWDCWCSNH